jgi:hypothetical protein
MEGKEKTPLTVGFLFGEIIFFCFLKIKISPVYIARTTWVARIVFLAINGK